jgi:DNA mismatch endonuclease (patch repair protein)
MSRIRGKDTTIELTLRSALHQAGFRFRKNVKGLPGTPGIVFHRAKLLIFVDGDFWHGYRFPQWGMSLP